MKSQTDWDNYFLKIAKEVSTASKDPSTKVGAVIVAPDHTVVSTGYNGFPRWDPDNEEDYVNRDYKYDHIIHGEMNALILARRDLGDCSLYTYPFHCCIRCAVHMVQAGITHFIAPVIPEELRERWNAPLTKTLSYYKKLSLQVDTYDFK